jgi:hypothetical protein
MDCRVKPGNDDGEAEPGKPGNDNGKVEAR